MDDFCYPIKKNIVSLRSSIKNNNNYGNKNYIL